MIYYISDLHFGHAGVLRYDSRPFGSVEEMDRTLIANWNSRVTDADDVYVLGDFCYRSEKPAVWYLEQLRGKKHLVIGNHEKAVLNSSEALAHFETVDKMAHIIDGKTHICACHFPIAEWNGFHKGHYHIYGHIHARLGPAFQYMRGLDRALNAGCMINYYMPVTFPELVACNQRFKQENP